MKHLSLVDQADLTVEITLSLAPPPLGVVATSMFTKNLVAKMFGRSRGGDIENRIGNDCVRRFDRQTFQLKWVK